jgi:hypothetical protein
MLNTNEIGDTLTILGALMLLVAICSLLLYAIVLLFAHVGLLGIMFGIGAAGIALLGIGTFINE